MVRDNGLKGVGREDGDGDLGRGVLRELRGVSEEQFACEVHPLGWQHAECHDLSRACSGLTLEWLNRREEKGDGTDRYGEPSNHRPVSSVCERKGDNS